MDKSNKDYKALNDFLKHIEKINQINAELNEHERKLKEKESITFDYHDEKYPYFEAINTLKEDGEKPSVLIIFLTGLITFTISLILAFMPVILVYVLLSFVLSTSFDLIIQYASYVVAIVILIFSFLKIVLFVYHKLMVIRLKRLSKKREEDIELAKNQSLKMIETEKAALDSDIKVLNQAITKTKKSKELLESKMDKDTFLHEHYYKHIHKLISYFEFGRVDTLKEAINLLEKELHNQAYFERLVYAIKESSIPSETLIDLTKPVQIEEKEPLKEATPIEEENIEAIPKEASLAEESLATKSQKQPNEPVDEALVKAVVHDETKEESITKKKSKKKPKD